MARIHSLVTFGPLLTVSLAGCGGTTCETARPPMPEMPGIHWADAVVQELAPSWPDDHRRPFLRVLAPLAMRSGAEHCIPPSVTVAQGILESGWGRSDNAVQLNNLFGIKASADEDGASAPTWEYIGGHRVRRNERFPRLHVLARCRAAARPSALRAPPPTSVPGHSARRPRRSCRPWPRCTPRTPRTRSGSRDWWSAMDCALSTPPLSSGPDSRLAAAEGSRPTHHRALCTVPPRGGR